jgi:predicted small lipoprotein YifL
MSGARPTAGSKHWRGKTGDNPAASQQLGDAFAAVICYGGLVQEGDGVIGCFRNRWSQVAAVGALVTALGLSACGRKGPLDPPPAGGGAPETAAPIGSAQLASPHPQSGFNEEGKAVAPPSSSQRRSFFLDWLVE